MEPKEKAISICDAFSKALGLISITNECKKCALVVVYENIEYLSNIEKDFHEGYFFNDIKYWKDVKTEILSL